MCLCGYGSCCIYSTEGNLIRRKQLQVYAGDHNAGGDTRFHPQNIQAEPNDTITFIFLDRHVGLRLFFYLLAMFPPFAYLSVELTTTSCDVFADRNPNIIRLTMRKGCFVQL